MLVQATETRVEFCELVEHPGGHDGGEFPQTETYGIAEDGTLYYSTGFPRSPTDTFCGIEPDTFVAIETREEALEVLRREYEASKKATVTLELLIQKFAVDTPFIVYFDNGEGDEVFTAS